MPYIGQKKRNFILLERGWGDVLKWLRTIDVQERKGFLAYTLEYLALYSFEQNYFGRSTGLDALRSAYNELEKDLAAYEAKKRFENGDV